MGENRRGSQILRANVPIEEDEAFGYALVTYLEEDGERARPIMEALREKGIRYRPNVLSVDRLSESSYTDTVLPTLARCTCYILVLSKRLLEGKDGDIPVLRNHLWYQVGYFSSHNTEEAMDDVWRLRLFMAVDIPEGTTAAERKKRRNTLQGTPMQDIHVDFLVKENPRDGEVTFEDFARQVVKNYPLLRRARFYGKECTLENEARSRIGYRHLSLVLPISMKDYENAELTFTDAELAEALKNEVTFGVRLLRFGKTDQESAEEIPLRPFAGERSILPQDYPISALDEADEATSAALVEWRCEVQRARLEMVQALQRMRLIPIRKGDRYAELRAELMLPVHLLFGVTFKVYIETKTRLDVLELLLRSTFVAANDAVYDAKNGRLWFSLGLAQKATEHLTPAALAELGVADGSSCGTRFDVIFPK